jgi:hypothetical protein
MYAKVSVPKSQGIAPGAAAAKDPNVTIVDVDDILFFPPRDSKGIVMVGDFAMKPGAKMIQFYATKSKISAPYTSDGDEDSISIKQAFEAQHPGNAKEIREFIQNWLGKNVIIIHGSCAEPEKQVVGTKCAPLQLKPEGKDDNDGRMHMLKFEAFAKSSFLPGIYNGSLVLDAPTAVADVAEVAVDTEVNTQYKLPVGTAGTGASIAFDTVTATDRDHITLIGSGGADVHSIEAGVAGSVTVILRNGSLWAALENSVITFEYVNGGATKYLVELSRS